MTAMQATDAKAILDGWDLGMRAGAHHRPRAILQQFAPHVDAEQLGKMPVGERERELLYVRQRLFGDELAASAACRGCGERLELTFGVSPALDGHWASPTGFITVHAPNETVIVARPPRVEDLEIASAAGDARSAQRIILTRCIESATRLGTPVEVDDLPQGALDALDAVLEEADPQASVELEAQCPRCSSVSQYALDVSTFLWMEIEAEALRLFRDVHRLARGYGWREADILSMSALRRRAYLEMLPA